MLDVSAVLRRPMLLAAGLYLVATIVMTWPLTPRAGSTLQDPGDPLFQIWVMRAAQHRLLHDPMNLYHANAFHPFRYSLAYSEEALSTAILAWPAYLLTGNDVLAYNLMFLFSFWLVAIGVYLLARELGAYEGAAFVAGLLAAFAPARYGHLSHLHMLVIGWLPVALWAFTVFARGGGRRYAVAGGLALLILLLGSLHLAVFGTLTLGLYLLFLLAYERGRREWSRQSLVMFAAALLVPYLLFAPTLYPHAAAGSEYGFVRTRAEIERHSSDPRTYLGVSPGNHFWPRALPVRAEPFFPGAVALAGAALSVLWWRRGRRWPLAFGASLTVAAGLLSLGFDVEVAGRVVRMPYALLYELAPPIRNIRGVGRFGLLTAIGIPLLAALGYSAAWSVLRGYVRRHVRSAGVALTALVALVACLELYTAVETMPVPDADALEVYDWLAGQPPGPVAEFPANGLLIPATGPPRGLFQPIQYMYGSTRHWNQILAGYSGYIPPGHIQLLAQFHDPNPELQTSAVTPRNVGLLQDLGIRWVVIHRFDGYDWPGAMAAAEELPQLQRVADTGDSVVYELSLAGYVPVSEQFGTLEIDEVAYSDTSLDVVIHLLNPRDNLAVGELHRAPLLRVAWTDSTGRIVLREELPLDMLVILQPGETVARVVVEVPESPGEYSVSASDDGDLLRATTRQVDVQALPRWPEAPLEHVSITWSDGQSLRHGDTLRVAVTWLVLAPLEIDLSATVQLLDATGTRRANHDLLPAQISPPATEWRVGQRVTLEFVIWIDPALGPGTYDLLTALYVNDLTFPRVPVVLVDGSVTTEVVVPGIVINP
ncbi:MAG TPA: hypothetical protein VMM78_05420 [Thermomicrobiales bacterium]|nr:hypothetical protein [Thermomicrobiales bacterium]